MKLRPDQLTEHLAKSLLPVYLVSGDDPLLLQEVSDEIRSGAKKRGYAERELFQADASFEWNYLREAAATISLFGDRKLIELRLPSGKPGDAGNKAITAYLENPSSENILLIVTGKLDSAAQRSKWVKAVESMGALIQIWPIDIKQLPQWITQRMRRLGLEPDRQAVQVLAERVEGNLLAASQEIEKLFLLKGPGPIIANDIELAVADNARFDVFGLVDTSLAGNTAKGLRMLEGLKAEGTDATIILWAFTRELRTLYAMAQQKEKGIAIGRIIQDYRVWQNRKHPVETCLRRLGSRDFGGLIQLSAQVDHSIKGLHTSSPWIGLQDIVLGLSGIQLP